MSRRPSPWLLVALVLGCLSDAPAAQQLGLSPREVQDQPPAPPGERHATAPSANATFGAFQSVQVNVDINGDNILGDAANEPSITVDPNDPARLVIGWRQFDSVASNFRQAGWSYSHDGGAIWRFPGVLTPGVFRSDPILDVAADGTMYYDSLKNNFLSDMFRSDTSGVSWLAPVPKGGGDKEWFTVDRTTGPGAGNLYSSWSTAAGCCGNNNFNRSIDGASSFSNATPVSLIFGTLSVGADGTLFIGGLTNTFSDTRVAVSTDAKTGTANPSFTLHSAPLGGALGESVGPNPGGLLGQVNVATDHSTGPTAGNVYLLASVDPPGPDPLDVNFSRSEDGGVTWSAPVRVNDDVGTSAWQWFGTMSVAPNGRIDVVWNDTRNHPGSTVSELFYSSSTDGGMSWTPNVQASPAFDPSLGYPNQNKIGDYYDMVSDDVGADLAWAATFNGEQDVYYLRIGPKDCNGNGVDDAADIALGTSPDDDGNGVPDECQVLIVSRVSPGLTGQSNSIHITRASPGGSVYLLLGTQPANLPIGPCPGEFLGMLSPVIVGPLPTDPTGHVTLTGFVGPAIGGATILAQAIELSTCNVSPTVSTTFP